MGQTLTTNSWTPHGYVFSRMYDHYLSYRLGTSPTTTPVLWSEIGVDFPKDFYFQAFGSYGLSEAPAQKLGNQIDLVAGKRWMICSFKFDGNVRFSNVAPLGTWWDGDIVYLNLVVSRDFVLSLHHTIRPSIYSEWMGCVDAYDQGTMIEQVGATHIWKSPLGIKPLSLVHCHFFSWADEYKTIPQGFFFRSDIGFNWRITPKFEVILPGVRFIKALDNTRKDDKSLMAGVRFTF
jgi:hypothetical protein